MGCQSKLGSIGQRQTVQRCDHGFCAAFDTRAECRERRDVLRRKKIGPRAKSAPVTAQNDRANLRVNIRRSDRVKQRAPHVGSGRVYGRIIVRQNGHAPARTDMDRVTHKPLFNWLIL